MLVGGASVLEAHKEGIEAKPTYHKRKVWNLYHCNQKHGVLMLVKEHVYKT